MPNLRPQVNTLPVQVVAPQSRLMSYPVTLSVRCIPHFLRPCPPGTQAAQTVLASYNIPPPRIPVRNFQQQLRPIVALPQLTLPRTPSLTTGYNNQQPFLPGRFSRPMQYPCIPSAYNTCPPQTNPLMKPTSVIDSPLHVIHLPPAPPPASVMQPQKAPPMKPISVLNSPLDVIHLPPAPPSPNVMQLPCTPSAYNSCPPVAMPTVKPTSVVESPVHVIHLPPAPPAPPPSQSLFLPRQSFVPVMCIPRPYYPCPPNAGVRKISKPSHKKGKSRAFMPKPVLGSYQYPYGTQQYLRPPFAAYRPFAPPALPAPVLPMQQPAQYVPQLYGFRPQFPFYRPPLWPQFMQRPFGQMSPLATMPQIPFVPVKMAAANDKPTQPKHKPKPIPAKAPISLQGSILVYQKPAPVVPLPLPPPPPPPPAPPIPVPCTPSPTNPCFPNRPFPMAPNPFPVVNPCIPSLANPCLPNPTTKATTKSPEHKPILLTRPLQLQGSVYINSRPAPPGTTFPGTASCVPTAARPCYSVIPPRQPFRPPSLLSPRILNSFSKITPLQPPKQPIGNVASPVFNPNVPQQVPAAPQSFVVQLPEISLSYPSPAPSSSLPAFPHPASNCPISCVRFPGPFCPPYCAALCCKKKSGSQTQPKKNTQKQKPKKTKRKGKILKVKKPKKG